MLHTLWGGKTPYENLKIPLKFQICISGWTFCMPEWRTKWVSLHFKIKFCFGDTSFDISIQFINYWASQWSFQICMLGVLKWYFENPSPLHVIHFRRCTFGNIKYPFNKKPHAWSFQIPFFFLKTLPFSIKIFTLKLNFCVSSHQKKQKKLEFKVKIIYFSPHCSYNLDF